MQSRAERTYEILDSLATGGEERERTRTLMYLTSELLAAHARGEECMGLGVLDVKAIVTGRSDLATTGFSDRAQAAYEQSREFVRDHELQELNHPRYVGTCSIEAETGTLAVKKWLEEATKGLSDQSIDHIRPEIEAHFAEAYDDLLETGVDETAARDEALKALGDAKRANKQFRKAYLTDRDVRTLDTIGRTVGVIYVPLREVRPVLSSLATAFLIVFGVALTVTPFLEEKMGIFVMNVLCLLGILMGVGIERFGVPAMLRRRHSRRATFTVFVTRSLGFTGWILLVSPLDFGDLGRTTILVTLATLCGFLVGASFYHPFRKRVGVPDATAFESDAPRQD